MKRNLFLGHVGQQNIRFYIKAWSWESTGSKVTIQRVNKILGNVCVVGSEYKGNKGEGKDHRGEFRIGGRGQVKLQYTMGEVDRSASQQAGLQRKIGNKQNKTTRLHPAFGPWLAAIVKLSTQQISLPFCQNSTNLFQNETLQSKPCYLFSKLIFFHQNEKHSFHMNISLREHQLNTDVINSKHFHPNTIYICYGFMRQCYILITNCLEIASFFFFCNYVVHRV